MKKLLGGYIRHNKKAIGLFIVFSLIFGSIFYLYNANINAVTYSVRLCMAVAGVFFLWDFASFSKKYKALEELKEKVVFGINNLQKSDDLMEQSYCDLIKILYEDRTRIISDIDREKSEMMDYYTLWAHQIKTPIAAMTLILQIEESEENKILLSELFKIEQYADMVLSYLRLESSATDFVIRTYNLGEIVRQGVRKYAPLFIRKKIAIDLRDLDKNVITDEKWLVFVIEQLLSNALKYTNSGKISIYCKDKMLVIEDTGMGIALEDIPRLGEKGFTGYNGRYDKKATGLGLYLCKQILGKLSHSISIESEVGLFTRVMIGFEENKLHKD